MKHFWVFMWGFLKELNTSRLGDGDTTTHDRHYPMYCESNQHTEPEEGMLLWAAAHPGVKHKQCERWGLQTGIRLHLLPHIWKTVSLLGLDNDNHSKLLHFYISTYVNSHLPACILFLFYPQKTLSNAVGRPLWLGGRDLTLWPLF